MCSESASSGKGRSLPGSQAMMYRNTPIIAHSQANPITASSAATDDQVALLAHSRCRGAVWRDAAAACCRIALAVWLAGPLLIAAVLSLACAGVWLQLAHATADAVLALLSKPLELLGRSQCAAGSQVTCLPAAGASR